LEAPVLLVLLSLLIVPYFAYRAFVKWLRYCTHINESHQGRPDDAAKVIGASGDAFPRPLKGIAIRIRLPRQRGKGGDGSS
jgi:hypothetical protein